jgi:hypothetical protein
MPWAWTPPFVVWSLLFNKKNALALSLFGLDRNFYSYWNNPLTAVGVGNSCVYGLIQCAFASVSVCNWQLLSPLGAAIGRILSGYGQNA